MATYYARVLAADRDAEGIYQFDGPDNLFDVTADEIVNVFFSHVEQDVLKHHVDWEINGILKNKERHVVTALGSLIPHEGVAPMPFLLMISDRDGS